MPKPTDAIGSVLNEYFAERRLDAPAPPSRTLSQWWQRGAR
jgi:hypothetical protein